MTGKPRVWLSALLCTGALVGTALVVTSAAASPSTGDGAAPIAKGPLTPDQKIAPAVLATFDGHQPADFWIRLTDHADTSGARKAKDRTARGRQVVDALQSTARNSQATVRRLLDSKGVKYKAFWVSNAIRVTGAPLEVARDAAELSGVAEIRAPQAYEKPEPLRAAPSAVAPASIEWGLANINADDVWALGDHGEGIVVANIDTGVQFDHPALVKQYRGNNGDGTFDHNYNWFDAQGSCDGAPCDNNGHGTHTMGTMAGDDSAGNQVGVAPKVTWIAANGCCPSDATLLASSEWMLAPTDLSGQNPDVSKRPHIINNSWGSTAPMNDPFMEDIQQAWADSGIFGVFANGNNGPGCQTSGSPGSRTLNYSVGAYDRNNTIAPFSSRGSGQDGQIKPNISAPGVDVRSALPGAGYGIGSGTSMATPHVAGTIALLWSRYPELARDVARTRLLLDLSAVNTLDTQCGGDEEDNSVYGEGRLDALKLIELGAEGTSLGTLSGMVTASDTGKPVTDAAVSVTGPLNRSARASANGSYVLTLPPGEYQVTVKGAFGYEESTATVQLSPSGAVTHDVALTPTTPVAVSGVVTDGGAHGWPLYGKVSASDSAGHRFAAFTDPETGRYHLPLVPNTDYTLRVSAVYPGYDPADRPISLHATELTQDVALAVSATCTAPGYLPTLDGTTETFDARRAPRGWTVTNTDPKIPGYNARTGWVFTNPAHRANTTGGSGNMAIVDSDHYGQFQVQNTYLTGPTVDLSTVSTPAVVFATDLAQAVNSTATAEVSTDGGATWREVWRHKGFPSVRGPALQVVQLPQAAGRSAVKVRFHYTGQWSQYWQLDDVYLGNRSCDAVDGGLVVGQVTDSTNGDGLTGATVTGVTNAGEHATTVSTPDDPALGDGLYWLFTTATGSQGFTAAAAGHTDGTGTTTITANTVSALDFALTAG